MSYDQNTSIRLEPFAVTKRQAFELIGSSKVVQRWLYWTRHAASPNDKWLIIVRDGRQGRETLIDYVSLRKAYERWRDGEEAASLPSENGGVEL